MSFRRLVLPALAVVCLLFTGDIVRAAGAPPVPAGSTRLRMQNVVKDFVKSTGQEVIGLGSWISGGKYKDVLAGGASDHDLRLMSRSASPAEAQREWLRARSTLTDLVKKEFGADADKVLKSVNLYPPAQIMTGVEDASDALGRFKKLGNVPNLGYTGDVAKAPAAFAEGLYGPGSKVWTQQYEKQTGRLFYTKDGKVFMGFTDLTHMSEGIPAYDIKGMCNTSKQWADHLVEELHEGRGDKVAKYLERLDRDLAKAKDLSKLPLDSPWRARIKEIAKTLEKSPDRLSDFEGEIKEILKRSRDEAAILGRMSKATSVEKKLLAEVMKDMRSSGRLAKIMDAAGEVVTLDRAITSIMIVLHVQQTAKFAGEDERQQAIATALAGALNLASFPAGFIADITNWTLDSAKAGGFDWAASTQEAWDLMAGIYSAVGRADAESGRGYTLDELVAKIDDEKKLEAVVYAKAMQAASRDAGEETAKTDEKVGQAIFARCFPIILEAWRARREELEIEYLDLVTSLQHTPILMSYSPSPASVRPNQEVEVTVVATNEDKDFSRKLARAKELLTILCRGKVFVDHTWNWKGGREVNPQTRVYTYDTTGVYPVTCTLKLSLGSAAGSKLAEAMTRRFELQSGMDVVVEEAEQDFDFKFVEFNVLIMAGGRINAHDPSRPEETSSNISNEETQSGMQLITDRVPIEVKGRTFRADITKDGNHGPQYPAKIKVEGRFNPGFTIIEELTISWNEEMRTAKEDYAERWSFTARGVPQDALFPTPGEYMIDWSKGEEKPKGFSVTRGEYLKKSDNHKVRYDDDDNEIRYTTTWREDSFDLSRPERFTVSLTFHKEAERKKGK